MEGYGLNNMDEVFINVKDITDLSRYFKKDIISVMDLVCALQDEIALREEREEEDMKEALRNEEDFWLERKKEEWRI